MRHAATLPLEDCRPSPRLLRMEYEYVMDDGVHCSPLCEESPPKPCSIQINVTTTSPPSSSTSSSSPMVPRSSSHQELSLSSDKDAHMTHRKTKSEGHFAVPPSVETGGTDHVLLQADDISAVPKSSSQPLGLAAAKRNSVRAMGSPPRHQERSPFSFIREFVVKV